MPLALLGVDSEFCFIAIINEGVIILTVSVVIIVIIVIAVRIASLVVDEERAATGARAPRATAAPCRLIALGVEILAEWHVFIPVHVNVRREGSRRERCRCSTSRRASAQDLGDAVVWRRARGTTAPVAGRLSMRMVLVSCTHILC